MLHGGNLCRNEPCAQESALTLRSFENLPIATARIGGTHRMGGLKHRDLGHHMANALGCLTQPSSSRWSASLHIFMPYSLDDAAWLLTAQGRLC